MDEIQLLASVAAVLLATLGILGLVLIVWAFAAGRLVSRRELNAMEVDRTGHRDLSVSLLIQKRKSEETNRDAVIVLEKMVSRIASLENRLNNLGMRPEYFQPSAPQQKTNGETE